MREPAGGADVDLIEDGMAGPSAHLAPGEEVAVAVWRRGRAAAILRLFWDPEDPEAPFQQEIEIFERVAGTWLSCFLGGSDWPAAYAARPTQPRLTGYSSTAILAPPVGHICVSSGVAPPEAARVRVSQSGSHQVVNVEPASGAFLVGMTIDGVPPTIDGLPDPRIEVVG